MALIRDSVVVITGASSGIGRCTAEMLAEQGAKLVLGARNEKALQEAAQSCEQTGAEVLMVPTDTADRSAMEELSLRALERFGKIDVWINNAAVGSFGKFDETPEDTFRRVVETDFFGYVNGMAVILPYFKEQEHGTVINVASVTAAIPRPYTSAYGASKAAVRALGASVRMELQLDHLQDIHVCTVMPATIDTPFFQHSASYAGRATKALPPVYPAEQVATTILGLIRAPQPEVIVGGSGRLMAAERALMPRLFERLYARVVDRGHLSKEPREFSHGNVFEPMPETSEVSGGWIPIGARRSRWRAPRALGAAAAGLVLVTVTVVARRAWHAALG